MRYVLIAHGYLPIPPPGWGAIEILVWDTYQWLTKQGHAVRIVNTPHRSEIIRQTNDFKPDQIHLHWDN
jgi:hypothetical protein